MNAMRRFFLLFGIGLIFPIALFAQFSPGTITPQTKPDTFSFNTLPKIIEVLSVNRATGGDGNYTYQWKINDVVIDTANTENYRPQFTTVGTFVISRWAKDGIETFQKSGEYTVTFLPQFEPGTITPQTKPDTFSFNTLPKVVEVLSVTPATGGDGNYTYQWKINDVVIDTANTENYRPQFTTVGTFVISRWAKDGIETFQKSGEYTATFLPQFEPGTIATQTKPDTFSFNTLPKIIEVLSVTPATGGDGNYTYQWKINDVVIDTATAINYYPTFTTNGEYTINRWAKDGFDEFQQSGQSYKVVILPQFNSG